MNQQKLKSRISEIAKETSSTFNEIWHRLVMERFLSRLAVSKYASNFIFKGGYLLTRYTGSHRETRDLDFLARKIKAERGNIQNALVEIAQINLEDGFVLQFEGISDLIHDHMKYPGFSAKFIIRLEQMKEILEIDIGIGDYVEDIEDGFELLSSTKCSLFEDEITLKMYPPEAIFAEKLQTAVTREELNSRMKDYHDIFQLIKMDLLKTTPTRLAVTNTFNNRETPLSKLPIDLTERQIATLQTSWSAYLRKSTTDLPSKFDVLIETINTFIRSLDLVA